MSDNASEEEQQQQMQEIFICDDVWLEVFAFLSPFELGLIMALISDHFDALVDLHFKTRKWSLGSLHIYRATGGNGAEIINSRSGEWLPIPQGPLPNKVTGFEEIGISYVDQTVIEFLQRIRRLFDSGTNVDIDTSKDESRSWEIIWQKIWPFLNDNICCFFSFSYSPFNALRQFSPAILRDCANLRLGSFGHFHGLFPEFPAEDNAAASSAQAVAKWLLTPREDGLPKMLHCAFYSAGLMEKLKRAFVNASEPVNFTIRQRSLLIEPFELKNNLTGERLVWRRIGKKWLLVRCPIVREEEKWAKWEQEAIEFHWADQWNRISIDFVDKDIGDGMVDAKAGPSKREKCKRKKCKRKK